MPIAEIEADCIITKHLDTGGMVDVDTVRCQFLYELRGNVYLNSDVSADLLDDLFIDDDWDECFLVEIVEFPHM